MSEDCCPPGSEVDRSLLTLNDLRMIFGPTDKLRAIQTFVISATLPSVTLAQIQSNYLNNQGFTAGDTLVYESLSCRIAADEKLETYMEIFNWMYSNTQTPRHPKNGFKMSGEDGPYGLHTTDVTLQLMTSHNNIAKQFHFRNAFPTSISGPEFNTQNTDTTYAIWDVSFTYDYFDIE